MNSLNNYIQIKNKILSLSNITKIVVVTKTFNLNTIKPIIDYGHNDFGENKVQEAKLKWSSVISTNKNINLHLIGKLQSNKVSDAVKLFNFIHSLSSEKLANICMKEEKLINKKIKYFIQINFSNSDQRNGIEPNKINEFVKYCTHDLNLKIIGLMTIPPINEKPDLFFLKLKKMASDNNLSELSMGMSNDYLEAVKYGSTYIRIGSKIFGDRMIK